MDKVELVLVDPQWDRVDLTKLVHGPKPAILLANQKSYTLSEVNVKFEPNVGSVSTLIFEAP